MKIIIINTKYKYFEVQNIIVMEGQILRSEGEKNIFFILQQLEEIEKISPYYSNMIEPQNHEIEEKIESKMKKERID